MKKGNLKKKEKMHPMLHGHLEPSSKKAVKEHEGKESKKHEMKEHKKKGK